MKKVTLFGIPMRRDVKVKTIVFMCLAAVCLLLYVVLLFFDKPVQVELRVPASGLTQTLFDSQNMEYKALSGFPIKHTFTSMPFTIDTLEGQSAKVGNGMVYNSGDYFLFYSEMTDAEQVVDVIKEELTDVLLLAGEKERTLVEVKTQERGYVNGCEATYYIALVTAYRGEESATASLCVYSLKVNEDIYKSDKVLLVGCMSTAPLSQETYDGIQQLSYMNITTLQFKKDLVKELEEEEVDG